MATQEKGRFQAITLSGLPAPNDTLVRAILGHSGPIAAQFKAEQAHERIYTMTDATVLAHYTKTELIPQTIGLDMPGLLPGGTVSSLRRSHVNLSRALIKEDGVIPDKFRRRDLDCVARVDSEELLEDGD